MNTATLSNIYISADSKKPNRCCPCTQICMPVVSTGEAVNITQISATIVNNTYSDIIGITDFVGVQYSTDPNMAGAIAVHGAVASPFSVILTGLQPNTTYYYRAFVSASSGIVFGDIKTFITQPTVINVITGEAVNITPSAATIANNTYSGITGPINFVGVQYNTNPSISPALTAYGDVGSPFSVFLTGLQPATTYYYHAVVSASGTSSFGVIRAFTTPMFN